MRDIRLSHIRRMLFMIDMSIESSHICRYLCNVHISCILISHDAKSHCLYMLGISFLLVDIIEHYGDIFQAHLK